MQCLRSPRIPALALVTLALAAVVAPHTAFGAKGATIRLPDHFAAESVRIPFEGFGGYNRGRYSGGEFQGEFTRIESRLGVFDPLYVANRGESSFTIEEPGGAIWLTATCGAIQRTATVRVVTLDLKKLTYSCDFAGADASPMNFVIGEPKRESFKEKLLARDRRVGEAQVLDRTFLIESIHEYQESKLNAQAPLGYLLKESNGVVVAAIDLLDWSPIVHLRNDLTESSRRAAVVVALALSVLRDPANSALED